MPKRERSPEEQAKRNTISADIRKYRRAKWSITNNTVADIHKIFGINLFSEMDQLLHSYAEKRAQDFPVVMDLGCDTGIAVQELAEKYEGKIKFCATSFERHDTWKRQDVEWAVTHANMLNRRFKPNSIDLIYSNFGITHSDFLEDALSQALEILKPGGKIMLSGAPIFHAKEALEICRKLDSHCKIEKPETRIPSLVVTLHKY